jgi:hypothetical protein
VIWHANSLPYPLFTLMTIALTIPFAVISWHFIERRALALKRIQPPWRGSAQAGPEPADIGSGGGGELGDALPGEQAVAVASDEVEH